MYIAKEYGHPITPKEVYQIIKQFDNNDQINGFLLDCLYNSLLSSCNRSFDYTWSYQTCYRCPIERNRALKSSIETLKNCINSFNRWNIDLCEVNKHIEYLRNLRLQDLKSIKNKRGKDRHKKKTRREYQKLRPKLKKQLEDKFGSKCAYCESVENLEIDHIHPVFKRGDNAIENLQLLCRPCHFVKSQSERGSL